MPSPTLFVRLSNEAKQSPGKAGILAGGLALAIYMWYPLFFGWMGKASTTNSQPVSQSSSEIVTPQLPLVDHQQGPLYQQYQELMNTEILTPWTPGDSVASTEHQDSDQPETTKRQLPNIVSKLQLTAVLVGGRTGNMANLNGQVVRQGETFWMNFQTDKPTPTFQQPIETQDARWLKVSVVKIQQNQIEVEIENKKWNIPVRSNRSFAPTQ